MLKKVVIYLFFLISISSAELMSKVVIKLNYPTPEKGSFSELPKTIYKIGCSLGRIEEQPDSALNLQQLIIYNKGDSWIVNQMTGEGNYVKDPGPSLNFYATIFGIKELFNFEFSREIDFLKLQENFTVDSSETQLIYSANVDKYKLVFEVLREKNMPEFVKLFSQDSLISSFKYLEYKKDLDPNLDLFKKPKNIKFQKLSNKPKPFSDEEIGYLLSTFFRNTKNISLIKQMIYSIEEQKFKYPEDAQLGVHDFFCEVFMNDSSTDWQTYIKEMKRSQIKKILTSAYAYSRQIDKLTYGVTPHQNDSYWARFFASGNKEYINKIIDHMKFMDEREEIMVFVAAGSAKWSLSSNCKQYKEVKDIVSERYEKEAGDLKKILEDVLNADAGTIKAEMNAIIMANKGNWKQ